MDNHAKSYPFSLLQPSAFAAASVSLGGEEWRFKRMAVSSDKNASDFF